MDAPLSGYDGRGRNVKNNPQPECLFVGKPLL